MVKTVIFDFDGTIADSLECVVNIVNKNSDNFGYKKNHKRRHSISARKKT